MQVFVGLNLAYAAKRGGGVIAGYHEAHLLDSGAIAIFDEENNIIQAATPLAQLIKVQKFYIAQGNTSQAATPKVSVAIDRNAFTQFFSAYKAPVSATVRVGKVATVGSWGFPGSFLDGTFATVVVHNQPADGYKPNNTKRYTVKVFSTDTVVLIGQRLRDAINADSSAIVTATYTTGASDDYLHLAAKAIGTSFTVGTDDLAANATVSKNGTNGTSDNFTGFGTLDKVKAALKEDALTRGQTNLNTANVPYYTYPDVLDSVTSGTFDGWTIQWKEEAHRAADVIQTATPCVALFLIVSGTGNADITTIMNLLFQVPETGAGGSASGVSSGEVATVAPIPTGGEG